MRWMRRSGLFSRQRMTSCEIAGGKCPRGGGSQSRISNRNAGLVDAPKALWPESISYNKAPIEKISLRKSNSHPETCSGEKYGEMGTAPEGTS